jgi:SagB-type dehydrogenase family enzyme
MKKTLALICLSATALYADIKLPAPQIIGGKPLMEALNARQSNRVFSQRPVDEQHLSNLLWAAFGVNRENGKRTAPSAMNRQEIDIYVALPSGLFLYNAPKNTLEQILETDIRAQIGRHPFTAQAPVGLIFVADYDRMKGSPDFYSAVDTGYISQNVYLFCASEGLNTVVLGSVNKDALHATMDLKPSQHIILTQPVGWPLEEIAPEPAAKTWMDGVYAGKSQGYDGPLQVAVTIQQGKITRVEVTRQNESRPRSALQNIPAQVVARQKASVDAVTGATITSRAVISAIRDALEQAEPR